MPDVAEDQLSVLRLVTGRLDAVGLSYMITGSIAGGHYGQPRMTRDIDVVVEMEPADSSRLVNALGDDFATDEASLRTAIAGRGMFNLIHRVAIVKVDFVVRKNTPYRLEEFRRRRQVQIDGHPLWMVTPEDLVLSKLVWAKDSRSELQLRDVRSVMRMQRAVLDRGYLAHWAAELSVLDLLREMES